MSAEQEPWRDEMSAINSFYNIQEDLKDSDTLRTTLEALREARRAAAGSQEGVVDTALAILDADRERTNGELARVPISLRPTAASGLKAMELFSVPELLENILIHLDLESLLNIQQAHKASDTLIRTSKKVQKKMLLRPNPGASFSTAWGVNDNDRLIIVCPLRDKNLASNGGLPMISISVIQEIFNYRFGSHMRDMLICQPPIFEVHASMECCDPRLTGFKTAVFKRRTGIRIGDLVELAAKLQREHATCPDASLEQHDEDGVLRLPAWFRAISPLQGDDSFFVKEQEDADRKAAEDLQRQEEDEKLKAYMAAKRRSEYIPRSEELKRKTLTRVQDAPLASRSLRWQSTRMIRTLTRGVVIADIATTELSCQYCGIW